MLEIISFIKYVTVQTFGLFIAAVFAAAFLYLVLHKLHSRRIAIVLFLIFFGVFLFVYVPKGLPNGFQYPFFLTTYGPGQGPVLPLKNVIDFFLNVDEFKRVENIARDPVNIPGPITRTASTTVDIEMTTEEVIADMAPGVTLNYWTFNGTVPGPFLRVREGDTVNLTLTNNPESIHHHSIDLHAVNGPGGGATVTQIAPGESKTFTFKALNPGLYVYHCAHPNVANHMAHGMYGLILVEPEEGLPPVDHEFYVMQGEFYTTGNLGKEGLQIFDAQRMLDGIPQYIVFNGKTGALAEDGALQAEAGDRVRLYVGNGGVNFISSFHVIGEIFDTVYPEAAIGPETPTFSNVQTTSVPAGGASIVEFTIDVPGDYILVDHALSRLDRGAWGVLHADGEPNPAIFHGDAGGHTH